jgi:hypothetical protein
MAITKIPAAGFTGNNFRNIIINGDMSIAQRGTSKTGLTNGDNGYWTCDRYQFRELGATTAVFTQTQETDAPSGQGFVKSLKMDVTTADTSLASDIAIIIKQKFEGQNLQYLKKGTASVESLTLSFWVKSNKTGTYIAELYDNDNLRAISKSYTINSANTWEKKTLNYAGDTTGTLDNDNVGSLECLFLLGAGTDYTSGTLNTSWTDVSSDETGRFVGQVNLADSTSNEWYITGVQLEAGTTASDFEFLPYDMNLDRCYRYYQVLVEGDNKTFGNGFYYNSTQVFSSQQTLKTMRTLPSIDQVSSTNYYQVLRNGSVDAFDGLNLSGVYTSTKYLEFSVTSNVSGTAGQACWFRTNNAASFIAVDAEL